MPSPPYPNLSKAPIVEAVIELRVSTRAPTEVPALLPVKTALADRFPISRDLHFFQAQIRAREGEAPQQTVHSGQRGIRLESADKRFVVLARTDGVAISQLHPYDTWEQLRDVARDVWAVYAAAVDAVAITRIGVRYINRIELREEVIDFDKVLTAGPKIPEALPQGLTEFFTRVIVPLPQMDATVMIAQAFEPGAPVLQSSSYPAVMLDIDAFMERAFEIDAPGMWTALETLRDVKNMAFFNSLTAETLEKLR